MFTNTYIKLRIGLSLVGLLIFNVYLFGQYPPVYPTPCNDHDPCTIDIVDHCGNCFHIRKDCDEIEACDDGDPCTIDIIDYTGDCWHFAQNCDDGDPSTRDYCDQWGICRHVPIDCDDGDPDTYDYIDAHGHCQHVREVCCDDGNPCTHDYIDPYTGECVHEFLCDDDDPCTIDVCNPNTGECWNTPRHCDDYDPCTIDYCDPYTGECVHEPKNCDDGDPCTYDYCDPYTGHCRHEPKDCDDGDPCTIDYCNPYTGQCEHEVDPHCNPCYNVDCDDNNPCTYDYCNPNTGLCVHVAIDCDDGDPCTIDYCNPYTGECVHEIDPWCNDPCGSTNCDDGNPCTVDYCNPNTGQCINVYIYCSDNDPCTIDSCDPNTGQCVHTPDPACNTAICAFTQGFWGNPGGSFGSQDTEEILDDILFNSPLVVGVVGQRSLTVNQANRLCIFDLLPGGGTSSPLPNNTGDVSVSAPGCNTSPIPTANNGSLNNSLLAQTMALSLNIKFDSNLGSLLLSNSCVDVGSVILNLLPNNPDVNDLLALANNALAGLTVTDYGNLAWAISEINETFNECNFPCISAPLNSEGSDGDSAEENHVHAPENISVQSVGERQHDFKLFPNPSSQTVMVDLRDYLGKGLKLQVFNTLGQPVRELTLAQIPDALIQVNVSSFNDGIYFMKVKIDETEELTREFVVSRK